MHSALPMAVARRRCPQAVIVPRDRESYRAASTQVMAPLPVFLDDPVARTLALWLSDGQPIQGMPEPIQVLGGDILFGWLPVSTLLVAAVAAVAVLLTTRMVWGRWIYSVGGSPEAARRMGIPVGGVLISAWSVVSA